MFQFLLLYFLLFILIFTIISLPLFFAWFYLVIWFVYIYYTLLYKSTCILLPKIDKYDLLIKLLDYIFYFIHELTYVEIPCYFLPHNASHTHIHIDLHQTHTTNSGKPKHWIISVKLHVLLQIIEQPPKHSLPNDNVLSIHNKCYSNKLSCAW